MSLPTPYQHFIYLSRYSRWLEKENRRETWEETVERYFSFFDGHLKTNKNYKIDSTTRKELKDAVLNLEIMPSMRSLMTAGEALERSNIAGYNCAYLAINRLTAFDETLAILLNGTGVGFSVERQFVEKLPTIAEQFSNSDTTIVVADSKQGWAKAYRELISLLVGGQIPKWDVSQVRPAGARLKVFGGRASGPAPLVELFQFTVDIFKKAAGRKLSSIECHDIVCMIGSVVVVGGVRRCCDFSYLIHTMDGDKQIKDIEIGDKTLFNGEWVTISNKFDNGVQDTVKINMEDGTFHRCTDNHRWLVFNHTTNNTEWVETKELNNGQYSMLRPKNNGTNQ